VRRALVLPALAAAAGLTLISAAAVMAVETDTVSSFPRALWWALALITTVGFIGDPPHTAAGELLSAVLMVSGFFLLALVSAGLASLFVREDERPRSRAELEDLAIIRAEIARLHARLDTTESAARGARPGTHQPGGGPGSLSRT
jgi:voltage-gated potassium channel